MREGAAVEAGASAGGPGAATPRAVARRVLPLAAIVAALVAAYAFGLNRYLSLAALGEQREWLRAAVDAHPVLAPLAFFAVYAVAIACSFPAAAALTIAGGFLFGWLLGGLVAIAAATLGASVLFLAARTAFGAGLRARAGGWAAAAADGFRENAFMALLALRLFPFVPFFVVNIIPALLGVRLRVFVGATALGIVPGAFVNAWLGQGLDRVLAAARAAGRAPKLSDLVTPEITLALAALSALAAAAAVAKRLRKRRET